MTKRLALNLFLIALAFFSFGMELAAAEDGMTIIRKVEEKETVDTSVSKLTMQIYPEADLKDHRAYEVLSYSKGDDDSYMTFMAPQSIKGLSILSKEDDQWIFFPSTGRVRKIASKSKDQSVQGVGGDFSYEDLGAGSWSEKYHFEILREESDRWVLEGSPVKDSTYSKIVITVDKTKYIVLNIDFFNGTKEHSKTLAMSDIRVLDGRETATRMAMTNIKDNSRTVIIIEDARYDVPIDDKYFNPTRFYK